MLYPSMYLFEHLPPARPAVRRKYVVRRIIEYSISPDMCHFILEPFFLCYFTESVLYHPFAFFFFLSSISRCK